MSDEEDPDFDQVWQGEKVDRKDNLMNNIDKMTHVLLKPMYALLTVLGVALVILGIGAPFVSLAYRVCVATSCGLSQRPSQGRVFRHNMYLSTCTLRIAVFLNPFVTSMNKPSTALIIGGLAMLGLGFVGMAALRVRLEQRQCSRTRLKSVHNDRMKLYIIGAARFLVCFLLSYAMPYPTVRWAGRTCLDADRRGGSQHLPVRIFDCRWNAGVEFGNQHA